MFSLSAKGLWAHKRRLVGMVAAIVLGVGFLAGALALGDTLSANFNNLFAAANGGTDVVVRAPSAVSTQLDAPRPLIPASLVAAINGVPGVARAEPSIIGGTQIIGANGQAIGGNGPPRLGGNWIPDPDLSPYQLAQGRAPAADDEVVINRGAATAGKLHLGDTITVEVPAPEKVTVVGIATFAGQDGFGTATFTGFTLAAAERIMAAPGLVDEVIVHAQPGVSQAELADRIAKLVPAGLQVQTGAEATAQAQSQISGAFLTVFRTVLVIFAGIALLVATFTISNTFSILVAQRNRESALLRALGGTRRQLLGGVLVESLLIGALSAGLGLLAGIGIAGLLKGLFDSAGFALPAGGLVITGRTVGASIIAGIAVTVLAGLVPAVRASRIPPVAAFRGAGVESTRVSLIRMLTGWGLTAAGAGLVITGTRAASSRVLPLVGAGALATTVGVVVLGPVVARRVTAIVGRPIAALRGTTGALARRNAMRNPRRTAAAATALMVGVAIVTLFTVFAASVRRSSDQGVRGAFLGDLAVTSSGFGEGTLAPQLVSAIATVPGVRTATGLTTGQARVGGVAQLVTGVDPARIGDVLDLHLTGGSLAWLASGGLAVSQHEADAHGWHTGTVLPGTLADGSRVTFTVGAVYRSRDMIGDYVVASPILDAHSRQVVDSIILVRLAPGASGPQVKTLVAAAAASSGKPTVQDRAAFIASASQGISFVLNIVYILLALAIVIAVLGIANTLSLAIHERTREIGLLRAVGQTRRQLRAMVRQESVIISLFGVLGGLGLGSFLGWGLAEALDRTQGMATFTVPVVQVAVVLVLGGVAGVLAALRPARRAARRPVLAAIATD